jgi:hypothetical protein
MTSKRGVGISNWISASPERFFSIVELVRFVKTDVWGVFWTYTLPTHSLTHPYMYILYLVEHAAIY